jgi:FkbM family methyltransferase
MGIGRLLYKDIPKLISAIRQFSNSSRVDSRGLSFQMLSDNWVTKFRARTFNEKEPEMLDWLDENLLEGDVFFDVGANVGIYSIYAALRKPTAIIYAFEPEYSNLHQLKMNIINNDLLKNVIPFAIAISDQTGVSYLHIQDFTPGAALSTEQRGSINKTYGKDVVWKEGIVTSTLDYISDKVDIQPNLIKIDVDGNELKILNGGRKVFSNNNLRSIIIEMIKTLPDYSGIKKYLNEQGFKLEKKFEENQIWSRP